jgi:hypothetical protein
LPAYRAVRPCLCPDSGAAASLQLARLAALGIIVKLLVVKEQLLAGGKDEIFAAIHAPEYLVLKFHDPVASRHIAWPAAPALLENRNPTWAQPPKRLTATALTFGGGELEGESSHAYVISSRYEPETPRARDCLLRSAGPGDCLR